MAETIKDLKEKNKTLEAKLDKAEKELQETKTQLENQKKLKETLVNQYTKTIKFIGSTIGGLDSVSAGLKEHLGNLK